VEEKALVEKALGAATSSRQAEQVVKSDGASLKQAARG
jgi:hypothetical protein